MPLVADGSQTGGYVYGGRSTPAVRRRYVSPPVPSVRREYAPYALTERMLGRLAPNLQPSWISSFYRRGGSVIVDPSIKQPGVTPGYGGDTRILLQSVTTPGLPGIIGHEAVHASLAQPFGGLPAKALQLTGAAFGAPFGRSVGFANAYNEAPAYQVGGPGRSGYLKDVPALLRPLFSNVVR